LTKTVSHYIKLGTGAAQKAVKSMKYAKFSTQAIAGLTLLALIQPVLARAGKGGETSGGGDEYVADFIQTAAREVYPILKDQKMVMAGSFLKAADATRAVSQERVFESCDESNQGREVAVCYNSQKDMFYISRTRYPLNEKTSVAKRALTAHEIFRRMKIEGDQYEISSRIDFGSSEAASSANLLTLSHESYLKEFPSFGIDNIILTSTWYRVDAKGALQAKNETLELLKQNLKTGAPKNMMDQLIEYEYKTGCDKNVDYLKRKERNKSSSSYSYDESGSGNASSYSEGYAQSTAILGSAASSHRSSQRSSYEGQSSGSVTYNEDYSLEERDIYCEKPSQWVRAVLRATTKIQSLRPQDQEFFISQHVHRTFEKFMSSANGFLAGIDSIILSPTVGPRALKSKFGLNGPNLLQSWVSQKISRIENGKKYVELLRKHYSNYEYNSLADQYLSLASAIAERASQVESPGLYAVVANDINAAETVLILSSNQLRKLDPNAGFQGAVLNKSKLTQAYLNEASRLFKCDAGYVALFKTTAQNPVEPVMRGRNNQTRQEMANVPLSCGDRYYIAKYEFYYDDTLERQGSSVTSYDATFGRVVIDFNERGCIPFSSTDGTGFDLYKRKVSSVCPKFPN
jgi:hypothetical protein